MSTRIKGDYESFVIIDGASEGVVGLRTASSNNTGRYVAADRGEFIKGVCEALGVVVYDRPASELPKVTSGDVWANAGIPGVTGVDVRITNKEAALTHAKAKVECWLAIAQYLEGELNNPTPVDRLADAIRKADAWTGVGADALAKSLLESGVVTVVDEP